MTITEQCSELPRYYDYRNVLALFNEDEAAFAEAWVHGTLPLTVRQVCIQSMPPRYLETLLLARMCRQLDALTDLLQQGEVTVFEDPSPAPRH